MLTQDVAEIIEHLPTDVRTAFAGKRILLTGACGFLGRYFVETFVNLNKWFQSEGLDKCEVVALDNLITTDGKGKIPESTRDVAFIQHNVIEPFHPERKIDFVIYGAGIASPYYYRKYPLETLHVSTRGLENFLKIAEKNPGSRFVFMSSSEIYGDPPAASVPTSELFRGYVSCLGPRACYDESKRAGETLVRVYHDLGKANGSIIRPFNVFGPGMYKTDFRVLPNFAREISEGKRLEVYGTGVQTRTFCYVTDAIRGFLQVLVKGKSGEPYNIGNPDPEISMLDLIRISSEVLDRTLDYALTPYPASYPADEPMRRCPDISKAADEVAYLPRVDFKDGLRRFYDWSQVAYKM